MALSQPQPLVVCAFDSDVDPLSELQGLRQGQYLRWYLADLSARGVVVEPAYFDQDYLAEFAAFYCTSTAGYPNVCRRAHYFSREIDRPMIELAASGNSDGRRVLGEAYLGFIVLRPIPNTPIGRTVLRWYPEQAPNLPRVVDPSRKYTCHVAGFELVVRGLAWQQQDEAVSSCATIALWTMLHSSAFDDRHVVPTTVEVTRKAHGAGLSPGRAFPSAGLHLDQLTAAVRDSGFAPLVIPGDAGEFFTREHFNSSLAAFIRSGYPVLISGISLDDNGTEIEGHAVCAVGFRQASSSPPAPAALVLEDAETEYVYVHDDNLGPATRYRVETGSGGDVVLRAAPPPAQHSLVLPDPTVGRGVIRPFAFLAAAHEDIRLSPDVLHKWAIEIGLLLIGCTGDTLGLTVSARFIRLSSYTSEELASVLRHSPGVLGRARLELCERVPPMSLHVGLVRFGHGPVPLIDLLFDTSDSVVNRRVFCHVSYDSAMPALVEQVCSLLNYDLGPSVEAF